MYFGKPQQMLELTVHRSCSPSCPAPSVLLDGISVCLPSPYPRYVNTNLKATIDLFLASNPTTGNSETRIVKAYESEPWKTGRASVYQYHPGGDTSQAPKDAPSALNVIIVPNVTLPKVCNIQSNPFRVQC